MAEYLIDFNRGSDSAAGSIAAPWKNLSKLATVTISSGDTVWLANDSHWVLTSRILVGTAAGTITSPATIAARDTGGGRDASPTITYNLTITSGQWTYSAPNNAWFYDTGLKPGTMAWIELGGGDLAMYQEAALPLASIDGCWAKSGNTIYLYAPSSIDPTTYYGGVVWSPSDHAAMSVSNNGAYLVIDGLKFTRSGTGIIGYSDTAGTRNLVVRNCCVYDGGPLIFANTNTAGDLRVTVEGCVGERTPAAFVHLQDVSGVGMGPYAVQHNTFRNSGLGFPQGAIYLQVRGSPGKVMYNDIADAKYGTPLQPNDGCCIYAEAGASQVHVFGNYLHDSICAMQDNSGRTTRWTGNVIDNCWAAMKCTDESNIAATNHTFINNTIVRCGSPDPVPQYTNKPGGYGWGAYETTSPVMNLDIRNNIFVAHPDAFGLDAAIETPVSAAGTIDTNYWYGFPASSLNYIGGAASPTPTNMINTDASPYITDRGALRQSTTPNALQEAGVYRQGVTLANGRARPGWTPVGAYMGVVPRATATTRTTATTRATATSRAERNELT